MFGLNKSVGEISHTSSLERAILLLYTSFSFSLFGFRVFVLTPQRIFLFFPFGATRIHQMPRKQHIPSLTINSGTAQIPSMQIISLMKKLIRIRKFNEWIIHPMVLADTDTQTHNLRSKTLQIFHANWKHIYEYFFVRFCCEKNLYFCRRMESFGFESDRINQSYEIVCECTDRIYFTWELRWRSYLAGYVYACLREALLRFANTPRKRYFSD